MIIEALFGSELLNTEIKDSTHIPFPLPHMPKEQNKGGKEKNKKEEWRS